MVMLLEPIKIGRLLLSNRLVMPPMATLKAEDDGKVSRQILDYYKEKSSGGCISLIIIEHSFVSQEGKANKNQLSAADDSVIEGLKKLAQLIHNNGSKVFLQLNHAGSATSIENSGLQPVAPSAVANPRKNSELPHALSVSEITKIVDAFSTAAGRAKKAGFDGVEIHSVHGYLLNQFLSPLSNKRTDEYGGSLLNRIRIHLEIIDAVRKEVGTDYPVALRLAGSDCLEGGLGIEDSTMAACEFEKAGIDLLDISGGFCGFTMPDAADVQGYFSPLSEEIKRHISIPVLLAGGVTVPEAAEELLAGGKADLIGVGRAVYKDSGWAKRAVESLVSRGL